MEPHSSNSNIVIFGGPGGVISAQARQLASAVAQHGMIHHEAIAAAKAGVVGLARSAGATYARSDVRLLR